MKKEDLIPDKAEGIGVAIIQEKGELDELVWNVYLINFRKEILNTVLEASKGYYTNDHGETLKTSTLRHMLDSVEPESYVKIEPIVEEVFKLNNEYWVSFYAGNELLDRKFVFVAGSINKEFFTKVPILNKKGILIH